MIRWLRRDKAPLPHAVPNPARAAAADASPPSAEHVLRRLEWSVLDWNEPAIGFYKKLGARLMDEWTVMRLDGSALQQLGAAGR